MNNEIKHHNPNCIGGVISLDGQGHLPCEVCAVQIKYPLSISEGAVWDADGDMLFDIGAPKVYKPHIQAQIAEFAKEVVSTLNRAAEKDAEIERLKADKKGLQRQIAYKDSVLREKNLALDALGYVWCSGGCRGGAFRFTEIALTEQQVEMVEINTRRLRAWFETAESRKLPLEMVSEKPSVFRRVSVDSLQAELSRLRDESEWTRVDDGLPEEPGCFLCQYENGKMRVCLWDGMVFHCPYKEMPMAQIIAYRNLPQPYRAEGSDG